MVSKKLLLLVVGLISSSLLASAPAEAQRRNGRPSGRNMVVARPNYRPYYRTYYRPFYYANPFWYGYGFGYGYGYGYPWFAYQGPFGPYGGYPYGYSYDPGSAMRLEVSPSNAEVYVDGYYAGIVDDFDGVFQRLRLAPGEHELTLYREGMRTVHQNVYLTPRATFKVKYTMEPLAAGDTAEPRPTPPPPTQFDSGQPGQPGPPGPPPQPGQGPPPQGRRVPPGRPFPPVVNQGPRGGPASSYGTLAIRVQPADATIVIDGERWDGPGQDRLVVEVAEGTHRVQIQKDGFETFATDVTIRRGESTPLNVSLRTR